MTGGLVELEYKIETVKRLEALGETAETILANLAEDTAKGAGSTFLDVDTKIAQRIANEGEYVFCNGFDKSGKFNGGIAAPALPEMIKRAREDSKGCKGTLIIMVAPALTIYAECLFDYTKMIPKYYVERSTLSDIAKKHGLSIKREEDVIEWLQKR